jgi:hypothetical protein
MIVHLSPDYEPVLSEILQAREFVTGIVEAVRQPKSASISLAVR